MTAYEFLDPTLFIFCLSQFELSSSQKLSPFRLYPQHDWRFVGDKAGLSAPQKGLHRPSAKAAG